jgi:hypothetical protein
VGKELHIAVDTRGVVIHVQKEPITVKQSATIVKTKVQ